MAVQSTIAIVGGGIAGLTLGRCLKTRGINAVIFERAAASHRYSYSIALAPAACRSLLQNAGVDAAELQSTDVLPDPKQSPTNFPLEAIRLRRASFEELLRQGLDIRWGHELEKVDVISTGVRLDFTNGQSNLSQLVVGADGVHSQVRKLFAADSALKVLSYVAFNGKRQLTAPQWQRLSEHFTHSEPVEFRKNGILLQAYLNHVSDQGASVSYTYSRRPLGSEDPCFKPNRANAGAKDIPESFFSEVEDLQGLNEPFASLMDSTAMRNDRLLHWLMRTGMITLENMTSAARQNVVFLGDALYTSPIIGSEGASTAIKDAVDLAEHIAIGESQRKFFSDRHASWKANMERGEERLQRLHSEGSLSCL